MSASIQIGNEISISNSSYEKRLGLRVLDGGSDTCDLQLVRYDTSGQEAETILTVDGGTGVVAVGALNMNLPDDSVDSAEIADGAVDPVHLASGVRTVALDGTPAITATDRVIEIQKTANTTTAITMTVTHDGHMVAIKMLTGDADSVYTAAVEGGTVTFNAAEEAAWFYCDGTTWRHLFLTGATFA
jgi:uncharacterized Zn-binding protein involved in type VI secretion